MTHTTTYGTIVNADSLEYLKGLPDNSIDSLVTDPPYGISFMGKKWDYDVPSIELWKEVLRVLKPGGHALIACGTRTQHRMAVNIEDAGFEIRDVISWVYGSGFPKSLNIGNAIDKIQGNEREPLKTYIHCGTSGGIKGKRVHIKKTVSRGTSKYEGWGTALKPACEFFTLARKPISEKNIAENVLKWGTGGINIDGCRVDGEYRTQYSGKHSNGSVYNGFPQYNAHWETVSGRFPANFIHDGSEEVLGLFPESKSIASKRGADRNGSVYGKYNLCDTVRGHNDEGSAARFFYCAKASPSERNEGLEYLKDKPIAWSNQAKKELEQGNLKFSGEAKMHNKILIQKNHHPTVKPIALMQYLCRLITPPKGTVLDPFGGSGTTAVAAVKESFRFIIIEREPDYIEIIKGRVTHAENTKQPDLFEDAI